MPDPSTPRSTARRWRFRYLLQFSLRSLLIFTTVAAIGCWWFLRPQLREEQFGDTPLRLRRQIRLVRIDPANPATNFQQVESLRGHSFAVINAGRWQVFSTSGDLLVDGQFVNNKQHGPWTTYHINGRKAAEGRMAHGEKVGTWRTWDEEGRLLSDMNFPTD